MKEYKLRPEDFELAYKQHKILSPDGFELNTWVMEPTVEEKKNTTIIIVGSDAGNMGFSLPYAFHLLNAGYRIVTFDYRGFGESSSFEHHPNNVYHEEYITDFKAIHRWCQGNLAYGSLGTLSFSMGTLVSSAAYAETKFDFYIGEGFVLSAKENKKRIKALKNKKMELPGSHRKDARKMKIMNIPSLLFVASKDQVTTLQDCNDFCRNKAKASTVKFDGDHLKGAAVLGFDNYTNLIVKFIENIDSNGKEKSSEF